LPINLNYLYLIPAIEELSAESLKWGANC